MLRGDKVGRSDGADVKAGRQRLWLLWLGQTISGVGSETTVIAFPLVAAFALHAGPAEMGLLVAAAKLPNIFVGVFAALLIDRVGPRRVLLLTEYGRAIAMASVPLFAWQGWLSVPYLVLVSFVVGSLTAAYELSYFVIVPMFVPEERLLRVNGLMQGTHSATQIAGPPLGGILVQVMGAARTLMVDSVSFLFSAATIHTIRLKNERAPVASESSVRAFIHEIRAGMASLWEDKRLRLLGLSGGGFNFFLGLGITVEVLYVIDVAKLTPGAFGVAMGIGLVGGLLASISVERLTERVGVRIVLAGGLLLASLGPLLTYGAAGAGAGAVVLVGAGQFFNSVGVAYFAVTSLSLRQTIVPRNVRAQVFASMRVLSRGGTPLGAMAGALVASSTSLGGALVIATLGQGAVAFVTWTRRKILPQ
ncbi:MULTISPECIES: MFS transporter [unclassified Streptomyces]|uniref:MFS transporter n=1 Tax=unclassified Streptomyces TaxID=2593676 RepID=UPI0035DC1EF5